jgi:putative addiction module component (TIGR02574 family)
MTSQVQAILDAALALPEDEREELVDRILESLPPEHEGFTDGEFLAELDRRSAEIEQGTVRPIPWSEVRLDE